MRIKKIGFIFMCLFLCVILASCKESPEELTIGLIPVRDADEMEQDFEPIQMYLEDKLGVPIKVIVTENYASLIEGMSNETLDIAWYGAFSYIAAESELELTRIHFQQLYKKKHHTKRYPTFHCSSLLLKKHNFQ